MMNNRAEWGDQAIAAKAADALAPVWKAFIKTKFFVAFLRSLDDDPKNYRLLTASNPDDGSSTLMISEARERLEQNPGDGIVPLSGAEILRRLDDDAGIQVVLGEGAFPISNKRARWLRSGIELTQARAATRSLLRAAAPAAPLPVLHPGAQPARQAPVLKPRYVKPVVLSLAATAILAAILIPLSLAPQHIKKPAPAEVPIPTKTAKAAAAPAAIAASAAKPEAPDGQVPFSVAYNSFTVRLPGLAEEVEASPEQVKHMGDIETHQYRLRADDINYMMEISIYRRQRMPADLSVEMDVAQRAIVGKDGTLIRATPVALRGAMGREVWVRLPSGAERVARYAFIGNKFCAVMVTVPDSERSAKQIERFLNSFQLN
ncbi:MAG: hypothetical protein V4484_14515 [Pseudomonadota bacterium]